MKSIRVTTFILIVFYFIGCSQTNRNDRERIKLNGNVKTVTQRSFRVVEKFDKIFSGNPILYHEEPSCRLSFDKYGNLITINLLNLDGKIYKEINYVLINNEKFAKKNYTDSTEKNEYDKNGNLIQKDVYNKDKTLSYSVNYKYDGNNNITEKKEYSEGKTLESIEIMKYDDSGNLIEQKSFSAFTNSTMTVKYSYEFDNNHNWVKKNVFLNGKPNIIVERMIEYY